MSTNSRPSNATVIDKVTQRLSALKTHVKNSKTEIAINGVMHKAADVIGIYQNSLDTRAALLLKRSEAKAAMGDRIDAEVSRRAADRALKPWVINQFGADSQQAHDFGFPPPKVSKPTAEKRAVAVKLAGATRVARHTMGKKEKSKIKGTLVVPTEPAAPAIPTAPAAPPASPPNPPTVIVAQAPPPLPNGVSAPTNGASPHS